MTYRVVDVVPDTDEWLAERRASVGASEVAAVMGLDPWQTALDVYKSKQGVDRPFDPLLSWLGHRDEPTISEWIDKFSGLGLDLRDGFMARSVEFPFIHASFDRVTADGVPVQLKTAHEYTSHKWDEGIPTQYRVQVQTEMLVSGASKALLVVRIGARDFRAIWELRDNRFIEEHLVPQVTEFWENLQQGIAPSPSTPGELAEAWPDEGGELEAPEVALEWIEKRAFLLATAKEATEEADQIKQAIGEFMLGEGVDTLTRDGRKLLTYKKQKGRQSLDTAGLREDHPDLVAAYTRQGADFLVMRTYKQEEKK